MMVDGPLHAKFPRLDQEKFAVNELEHYMGGETEPLVVCRVRDKGMLDRMPEKQVVDYVVRENHGLYVGNKHWVLAGPSTTLGQECRGGADVLAAGEMMRVGPEIAFNLGSGTFQPTEERAAVVHQVLSGLGYHSIFLGKTGSFPPA